MFLQNIYFQILFTVVFFTGTTSRFLFDSTCVAPLPCTCFGNFIECDNKHFTKVPVFTRHHEQYSSIIVDLGYNQLTTIPAFAFKNLSALNATDLSIHVDDNHISMIETRAFSGVENVVTYLDLENNNLTHLPLALGELSSLQNLYLLGNPLVKLGASVLGNFSSTLNIFTLAINRFESFPDEIRFLSALSSLTINSINFTKINSMVFHGFENTLTYLQMSHAKVNCIPAAVCRLTSLRTLTSDFSPSLGIYSRSIFDACSHAMGNVTYLSLKYDQLTTLPKLASIFPRLHLLNLRGNALHFIESSSFFGLNSLTYINLGDNNFTRIPFAVNQAFSLRTLSVDYNQIDTIEDLDLSSLRNLTKLLVNDNPIVYISPFAFTHTPFLDYIDMKFTNLSHIPKALLALNNLSTVVLIGKPIDCSCRSMNYLKPWNVTSVNISAKCSSGTSVKTYLTTDLPKCH